MSAQSKNRKSRLVSKKRISSKRSYRNTIVSKNFRNFGIRLLICLVIIILALFYFFQPGEFWSAKRKTVVAFQEKSGDVTVAVFDPNLQEIISIFVPADTEVAVAQQKGVWKLKSVLQLSKNERLSGELLPETLTKYLQLPVRAWAKVDSKEFTNTSILGMIKTLSSPMETNLTLKDKFNVVKFAYGVDNTKKITIDLKESSYLRQKLLTDDTVGYVKNGKIPQYLSIAFQEPKIAESNIKVTIIDATQKPGFAEQVGELIESLGAKVSAINKVSDKQNEDCLISSKSDFYKEIFSQALYCPNTSNITQGNSEVEVLLTKKYLSNY